MREDQKADNLELARLLPGLAPQFGADANGAQAVGKVVRANPKISVGQATDAVKAFEKLPKKLLKKAKQ